MVVLNKKGIIEWRSRYLKGIFLDFFGVIINLSFLLNKLLIIVIIKDIFIVV